MKRLFFSILWCLTVIFTNAQEIKISEFMAINQSTIADEDGEYSDWIEIYNDSDDAINLEGWSLTDIVLLPEKWVFPNVEIAAKECLLIFASGKDKAVAGSELHTNFKLSGSGEYLAFLNDSQQLITAFSPMFPEQTADQSFVYYQGDYVSNTNPSPGVNQAGTVAPIIPAPVFDKAHGFYETSFSLSVSSSLEDVDIYYTLDGSEPSIQNGIKYSGSITISQTSIVRAVVTDGSNYSKSVTQTYLFLENIVNQNNTPVGYPDNWGPFTAASGNITADYEIDPDMVSDATFKETLKNALVDIPTLSLVSDKDNFFSLTENDTTGGIYVFTGAPLGETTYGPGRGWERPVSMEYFDPKNDSSVQVNCGIRLQGGHSRRHEKNPKHSFLLVFKDEYGPSKLNFPLFEEGSNTEHNKLILRAGFGNSWTHHSNGERVLGSYQRDIWGKDTQRDMGHPSSNSTRVHLYINGIYWGMYSPSERMDDDFGANYLGGDPDEYDVIKDYAEVSDGSIDAWNNMMNQANAGLTSTEAYQKIQGNNADGTRNPSYEPLVDIVNLADYMLINFYGSNSDWDHHNWASMRNRNKPGKGFKFFSWDGEHLVKSVFSNNLGENNDNCPSRVFQKLMENNEYKRVFADRVQLHCYNGGALTPEAASARWSERSEIIKEAVNAESARWGDYRRDVHPYQTSGPFDLYDKENYWLPQQDFMLNTFFPQRTEEFINSLQNTGWFPDAEAPALLVNNNAVISSEIEKGDVLTMTVDNGAIYYTTDGTDPAVWKDTDANNINLVGQDASKKVLVPTSDIGTDWMSNVSFNDASWSSVTGAPGGVGYENGSGLEPFISLDVKNSMASNTSCYIRIPFSVTADQLEDIKALFLNIRYDDGFVAYLNGTQIASGNVTTPLTWNSNNSGNHEGDVVETIGVSEHLDLLVEGTNLLAIQGVNNATTSSDFIILPELYGTDEVGNGGISPLAEFYDESITINASSNFKARALYNGEWSAMVDQYFVINEDYQDLKITEINYHPFTTDSTDVDKFEFIEIKNTGDATIDLYGLEFVKGIEYEFADHNALYPGDFIVLAGNPYYFYTRYGFYPYDEYKGKLDNNGERIVLRLANGDTIISCKYNDNELWSQDADGIGNTLVSSIYNPTGDQDSAIYWRASYELGGSPGADDIEGISFIDTSKTVIEPPVIDPGDTIVDPPVIDPPVIDPNDTITDPPLISINAPEVSIAMLNKNYPNPFSDVTYIHYTLSKDAEVELSVYDLVGKKLVTLENGYQQEGPHHVEWNLAREGNASIGAGVYFGILKVNTGDNKAVITIKMMKK